MKLLRFIMVLSVVAAFCLALHACGSADSRQASGAGTMTGPAAGGAAGTSWAKTYLGVDAYAYGSIIEETADGGYVSLGTYALPSGEEGTAVLKLNGDGTIAWQKLYAMPGARGRNVRQTRDGGYVVAGDLSGTDNTGLPVTDLFVLKLNADGTIAWQRQYAGLATVGVHEVRQTADGGYAILVRNSPCTSVVRLDADGSLAWVKRYLHTDPLDPNARLDTDGGLHQTADGGFVIGGWISKASVNPQDNSTNASWVAKLDANGAILWSKAFIGLRNYVMQLHQTTDDGYILGGRLNNPSGDADFMAMKLDSGGDISWLKRFGTAGHDRMNTIRQASDGGYICAGITPSAGTDFWVVKLRGNGSIDWQRSFGDGIAADNPFTAQSTGDGGFVVAGTTTAPGASSLWILKLRGDGSCPPIGTDTSARAVNASLAPTDLPVVADSPVPREIVPGFAAMDIDVTVTQQAP